MLGNLQAFKSSADFFFFFKINVFKKKSYKNAIRVANSFDPGRNRLLRLVSAEDRHWLVVEEELSLARSLRGSYMYIATGNGGKIELRKIEFVIKFLKR